MNVNNEKELLQDMISKNISDLYYWDYLRKIGFHIHRTLYNNLVAMKRTKKMIQKIPLHEFLDHYNKHNTINNVSADCFFYFLPF